MLNKKLIKTRIKVFGIGGAGGNAVSHMFNSNLQGVEFICANTDSQALFTTKASVKINLGSTGLGSGSIPEKGRLSAEKSKEEIKSALNGANMVFITAGMGGGTGTGACPVIAEISKNLGILTVGIVTKPFSFEGKKRYEIAEEGINKLYKYVHSLIVILNENLYELMDEDATQEECFKSADYVLHNACAGIAEIINVKGNINVDFEDVKTIMKEKGKSMMGTASANGKNRARLAAEQAISCPLLDNTNIYGAKGLLINITANKSLKMLETREIMNTIIHYAAEDANIIFGIAYDEDMGEKIRVTVVATGIDNIENYTNIKNNFNIKFLKNEFFSSNLEKNQLHGTKNVFLNSTSNIKLSKKIKFLEHSGLDYFDIPSFLRRLIK